jgi:nickel transport protein
MVRRLIALLAFPLLLVVEAGVQAHDYWFEHAGEMFLLHRGHQHSQHAGEKEVPLDPQQVQGGYCLAPGEGHPVPLHWSKTYPLRVQGPCLALIVTIDAGYWSQTLSGLKQGGKDELSGVLSSWRALESVKRVEAWDARLHKPLSPALELVFTGDPFFLSPGDKLRLIAMRGGEPAAGVTLAYDGDARGVSGADGRINLRIRHRGPQHITASLTEPSTGAKADKRVLATTLLFDLGEPGR